HERDPDDRSGFRGRRGAPQGRSHGSGGSGMRPAGGGGGGGYRGSAPAGGGGGGGYRGGSSSGGSGGASAGREQRSNEARPPTPSSALASLPMERLAKQPGAAGGPPSGGYGDSNRSRRRR
ncbi:MAG: hypothetical protein KBG15_11305, partial [Kofleriaceae bacterium]|nr:hypothetical protein [Kofleriaceae bacterium]